MSRRGRTTVGPVMVEMVREAVKAACLSRSQVLERAGFNFSTYHRWRTGERSASTRSKQKLAAFLREWAADLEEHAERLRTQCEEEDRSRLAAAARATSCRDVPPDVRAAVLDRYGRACRVCGSDYRLAVDHVIPISRHGDNDPSNLQALCGPCNSSKSNLTMAEWIDRDGVEVP